MTVYLPRDFSCTQSIKDLKKNKLPNDVALWIVSPTVADPGLAPPGEFIVLAGAYCPSDMYDPEMNESLLHMIEKRMEAIFPGLEQHVIWKQKKTIDFFSKIGGRGAAEAIGWAQRYDQDGPNRISPKMPVDGLYIVGTDASSGLGIGTELAAESALIVHKMIVNEVN